MHYFYFIHFNSSGHEYVACFLKDTLVT